MLYSLTNKKQTDAWADIYTEMKEMDKISYSWFYRISCSRKRCL